MPEDKDPFGIKSVRPRHDDPEIPADVEPRDLDRVARAELKTLSKENADEVAKHLVMAARLIDEYPELAHRHAISAGRRAGRVAVVRETLAITAYATGDFALALRELRTYRRISGSNDQLPMMVDSERGLGRPDRALELGRSVPRAELPVPVQVELAIAMSGARLDLGQPEAALAELEIAQLDPNTAFSYSPALFDSYASVLEELGRTDEAARWAELADRAAEALGESPDGDDETVEVIEEEVEFDGSEKDAASVADASAHEDRDESFDSGAAVENDADET
jgi:tetratricopeptide (TPR) repeat protein